MKALREQIDNQWAVTSKQKMEYIFASNQHLPIKCILRVAYALIVFQLKLLWKAI